MQPDEHDGSSWVGLIAFALDRASLLGGPPIAHFGAFAEVNVRLYVVDARGRRGVVFLSLEASRLAAVLESGGNLSHHHGVGLNRSRFVAEALGSAFPVWRTLKRALDPADLLNPGKLGLDSARGATPWP